MPVYAFHGKFVRVTCFGLSSDNTPPCYVNICQTSLQVWPDSINDIYIGLGFAVFTSLAASRFAYQTQPILRRSLCLPALSKSQAAHGYR